MMMPLDKKSSLMKHVTVSRILLIAVLGCAAVTVHWAFQLKSECGTLCTNISPKNISDDYNAHLRTTLLLNTSSSAPKHSIFEHSSRDGDYDYRAYELQRIIARTTMAARTDQTDLKSTTVRIPSTSLAQSSSVLEVPASFEGHCTSPLFCSSKFVRNCITNEIIGRIPDDARSQQMKPPASRSVETSHMRRQSFKKVFDTRAWGHDWDLQHRGLNASGPYQSSFSSHLLFSRITKVLFFTNSAVLVLWSV